jgi:diaminopimelate decarboxylase
MNEDVGPEIRYRDGALWLEEVPLAKVAARVGTPVYCYSSAGIERRYRRFAAAFADRKATVFYAVKANSNQAVIATLARLGAGADIVSEGEFRRALAAGMPGEKVIFSGVGKTAAELDFALRHRVHQINVESETELTLLSEVAVRLGVPAPMAVRVNPGVDPHTHTKISTGKTGDKFGIDLAHARGAYLRAAQLPGVEPVGIALHIGSMVTELAPLEEAFGRVIALARELRRDGIPLKRLDLGGGIAIRYRDETPFPIEDYAALVKRLTDGLDMELGFEPGRAIVGNAGVLLTRILAVKDGEDRRFVIVDAAMNDLIRPALYDAWHDFVPVAAPAAGAALRPADIVGPVCESGDIFARQRALPPVTEGELLAILSAGAYGAVMGSAYNTRLPTPEVLVHGEDFAVVRPRPSYDALLAQDRLPAWLAASS